MDQIALARFKRELKDSDLPDEAQAAAEELVTRLAAGEAVYSVLKDLAEPLYLTQADILRHIELKEPTCH